MQTTVGTAIALEAARLAFLCSYGAGLSGVEPGLLIDSVSSFEQEKAELLAGIWEEVGTNGYERSELQLGVCCEMLAHLAGLPPLSMLEPPEFTIQ